jgi:hypothetical protein
MMNTRFSAFHKALLPLAIAVLTLPCGGAPRGDFLGRKMPELRSRRNADGSWGLAVSEAGMASAEQRQPLKLEVWDETKGSVRTISGGYATMAQERPGYSAAGRLTLEGGASFDFRDLWELRGDTLRLDRTVQVHGNAAGGFLSAAVLDVTARQRWPEVEWFAPGMIYGGFANLTDVAIGGRAHYRPGNFTVRIREDRLPAPLVLAHFSDGSSLAVLNPAPRGDTTAADANDVKAVPLVDERFRFGAVGAEERGETLTVGYWYPGSEGEVTYAGNTYPGGQLHQWRQRFHPIKDGLTQRYEVTFRVGRGERFAEAYPRAWRWAWQTLRPAVTPNDIPAARRAIVDVLARNAVEKDGRTSIPFHFNTLTKTASPKNPYALLGFCGKNLEAAQFLLREAELDSSARGERLRRLGEAIIASFLRLKIAPPEGEGFRIEDGVPVTYLGRPEVFLRSFADDLKSLVKAYQREKQLGREHPEWLAWCRSFGDWLLTQQQAGGGFPRSWRPGTGEVIAASPNSSYNAVPLLVLLTETTGDRRYLAAAIRAAEFCWANGQSQGRFVGGTIDNPDVLDKEAATLSLEAYLCLYQATNDRKWLPRAIAAADFAETWIYMWNVPMPPDDDDARRGWKRGVSTVGLQLICTGHSLVDACMAFDADEFAELAKLTGDSHCRDVARLLLHNTKNMLTLPGRVFDLGEPGWQQEHWSLAPPRGHGLHRGWLPWVATSQLNGIFGLMEVDKALLEEPPTASPSTPGPRR